MAAGSLSLRSNISLSPSTKRRLVGQSPVPARELSFAEVVHYGFPHAKMDKSMRSWKARNLRHLLRGAWRTTLARKLGIPHIYGQFCMAIIDTDGRRVDYGLVSLRVITVSGAQFVVDAFQGLQSISSMRFHGIGSGATPESPNDTALVSEFGAQYNPINNRAEGTQAEGASANIYRTVGFIEVTDTVTIAESGIFSQSSVTSGSPVGGVMLDRLAVASETVFAGFVVQSDYRLTVATGT